METLSKLIGKRLKEIRNLKGFKQEDMERFGLSYKYYQRIESGRVNMTLNTIERIAQALEVDVREIFILPLNSSEELNELAALVAELINKREAETIRKLKVFIRDIL